MPIANQVHPLERHARETRKLVLATGLKGPRDPVFSGFIEPRLCDLQVSP